MRCHYEVLGVDQKASSDEIKKSYRKLALKLHPDKNLNEDPEVAKSVFQELQQAFEVLSDQQERAWYDRHRDAILSGANDEHSGSGHTVDLFPYFTSSCYKGFEGKEGFYGVYSEVFTKIGSEENEWDVWPSLGSADSDAQVWQEFYNFWSGYNTTKIFAWFDQYDTRQADNRRIFRAMEKENKKFRDAAKKEYNDLVRSLVAFVRKRDPRVKAFNQKLEAKREENARKTADNRKKKLAEQAKLKTEAAEAYKKSTLGMKSMEDELEKLEDALDAEEEDNLYCVACDKEMRNEKAVAAHSSSKKHLENVERLKELLREEEGLVTSSDNDCSDQEDLEDSIGDQSTEEVTPHSENEEMKEESKPEESSKPFEEDQTKLDDLLDNHVLSDSLYCLACDKDMKDDKALKAHVTSKKHLENVERLNSFGAGNKSFSDEDKVEKGGSKKSKKKKKGGGNKSNKSNKGQCEEVDGPKEDPDAKDIQSDLGSVKAGKKKGRRKAKGEKQVEERPVSEAVDPLACQVCKSQFSSKNKLFAHLKDTKHAVRL